jgi:hypothetical protein
MITNLFRNRLIELEPRHFRPFTKIKSILGSKFTLLIVPPKERLLSNKHPPLQTGGNFLFSLFFAHIFLDPTPFSRKKKLFNLELPHVGVHEGNPGTTLGPRFELLPLSRPVQLLPFSEDNHRPRYTKSHDHRYRRRKNLNPVSDNPINFLLYKNPRQNIHLQCIERINRRFRHLLFCWVKFM